jgi:hypothetical protein
MAPLSMETFHKHLATSADSPLDSGAAPRSYRRFVIGFFWLLALGVAGFGAILGGVCTKNLNPDVMMLNPDVMMMESTENRLRADRSGELNRTGLRSVLA